MNPSNSKLLFQFLVCCIVLLTGSKADDDDDHGAASPSYDADTFKTAVYGKRHFVMFFAPWCGHCKNLAPTWNELAKIYNKDQDGPITVAKVDCTEHKALCSDHEVKGFPTLKFFEAGAKTFKRYSGKRDLDSLKNFVQEQLLGEQKEESAPPEEEKKQSLVVLDDKNFEATVASGAFFIKFYAPWCGHCKRLAPTWDELAETLADNEKVSIAKIDCTQSTVICKKYDVRGYPTLLWFQNGEKTGRYQSGRTLEALKEYVGTQLEVAAKGTDSEGDKKEEKKEDAKEAEPVEGAVSDLTADNFKDFLSTRLVFVKFFAPWCGHCKRLAPTWEELGKATNDEQVSIAKVDCTQHKSICDDNGVKGYPTLKIFRNGVHTEDYRGARSIEDLTKFVNKHIAQKDEL